MCSKELTVSLDSDADHFSMNVDRNAEEPFHLWDLFFIAKPKKCVVSVQYNIKGLSHSWTRTSNAKGEVADASVSELSKRCSCGNKFVFSGGSDHYAFSGMKRFGQHNKDSKEAQADFWRGKSVVSYESNPVD